MFDFFNYNFNSLISIFAALLGMAFPLILQTIQRIDEMYNSTRLATFFQQQWYFRLFSNLLLISIPVSIVAPFVLYYYNDYTCALFVSTLHTIIVFALAMSAFILFKYIMMTTNPDSYLKYLSSKLNGSQPPLVEMFQIMKYASDKENYELFADSANWLYTSLNEYRQRNKQENQKQVWKMLHELYKQHSIENNHFFSSHNLITDFYFSDTEQINLTEEEYIYIWKTVDAVLCTDNDSWVYSYWTSADQYFRFALDMYADENKQLQWQQKRFKEQHFMLGALLAYKERYDLLGKLMYFSNTMPPRYVLVPSTFCAVLSQLKVLINITKNPLVLTQRYQMTGAPRDVSSDSFILGTAYRYASLLLIRLESVNNWNITYSNPLDLPDFSGEETVESLNEEVFILSKLKNEISQWNEDTQFIKQIIVNIPAGTELALKRCSDYIDQCNKRIDELENSTIVDQEKREYLKNKLLSALKSSPLLLPVNSDNPTNGYKRQIIANYFKYQLDKKVLQVGTRMHLSNLPEVLVERMNMFAYRAYNLLFLLQPSVMTVRVAYKDIIRTLDTLKVNENYAVLSLGVHLGNFESLYGMEEDKTFVEQNDHVTYNGCEIYNIPSTQQSILVMQKNDMPYIRKEKKEAPSLKLIDEDECFYSNIDDIKELLETDSQFLYLDRGIALYSKEDFKYIRLNMVYNSGFETDISKIEEARELAWA